MPPRRWLAYVTPAGLPVRRGHSAYGLAAVCFSVIAILTLVSIVRGWLPLSLLPLAVPAAGFAWAGSLVACFAGAADTTAKQLFTWIGAATTGLIPLAGLLASEPAQRALGGFVELLLSR